MAKIKLAVADDQVIFRTGLVNLLNEIDNVVVVLEANNGKELLRGLRKKKPQIAILDYRMPELNGEETAKKIQEKYPELRILMLSMYDDEEFILGTIRNGANGYLTKDDEPEEIKRAIESIVNTGYYVNDRISKVLVRNMMDEGILKPKFLVNVNTVNFTDNEITVIRLLARELCTKEIADQMNKSERTIDGYRTDILEKTGARNSIGIVMFGIKAGIVIV